jgi:hypothetical protein
MDNVVIHGLLAVIMRLDGPRLAVEHRLLPAASLLTSRKVIRRLVAINAAPTLVNICEAKRKVVG